MKNFVFLLIIGFGMKGVAGEEPPPSTNPPQKNYIDTKKMFGVDTPEYLKELGSVHQIQKYIDFKLYEEAMKMCNEGLLSHPDNRMMRLERAHIYELTGEKDKSEAEIDFLIEKYPAFGLSYYDKAKILLRKELLVVGKQHTLLEWLQSKDEHKINAAMLVIYDLIKEHQSLVSKEAKPKLLKKDGTDTKDITPDKTVPQQKEDADKPKEK